MIDFFKKYWFMLGLITIALLIIADDTAFLTTPGIWLGAHRGPDGIIVVIFFLSGMALDSRQIQSGVTDLPGTLLALLLIFGCAPIIAFSFSLLPLTTDIILGLYLVAIMPTTLSSGVVMSGSAGGNMAHALLITILANSLAVFTLPLTLGLLLGTALDGKVIGFDQAAIMVKIASLVLLPLICGIWFRRFFDKKLRHLVSLTSIINQGAVLAIVWIALSSGKEAILAEMNILPSIMVIVFFFHLFLILIGLLTTRWAGIGKGRRESVIIMGGQKTLPLSVILQVSLFPESGIALVVCVVHHLVHLIMDAFLLRYLLGKKE